MKSIIHISGLERHYKMGDHIVAALDGVDLEVNPGDFLMIVGSSGSGKSTLMHLLGLLDIPTGGVMEINSQSMTNCNDAALSFLRNEHIGFVFQQFNLLNDLNVIENIGLPLVYRGVPKNIRQAKAKELASKLGLGNRLRHHPKELSGGQLQRVAIARALIAEPDIILADEPTGNLDSTTSNEIMQILYDLNQQGHTIIMVTHDPKLANTGTRKITLSDGKIIEDCPGQRTPNPNPIIRESNVASKKNALPGRPPQDRRQGRTPCTSNAYLPDHARNHHWRIFRHRNVKLLAGKQAKAS